MCIIIDTNSFIDVFVRPSKDYGALSSSFRKGKVVAVWGGKLVHEYWEMAKYRRIINELDRIGYLRAIDNSEVEQETTLVKKSKICKSDDQHIIGLARASGVRLLCTNDHLLWDDFKNRILLNPVGKIYKNASHHHLIHIHCRDVNSRA